MRRGIDKAVIQDLVFSKNSQYLGASSNHATVHVWKLPMNKNGIFDQTLVNSSNEGGNSSLMLKIYSKFTKLPLSYARWSIDIGGQKKYLAFSDDEN